MKASIHTRAFAKRHIQCGLSLIELMISITIGLLILSSLATLFVNQSKARNELDKSNRMIDNGRYALEVLSDNLKLAGFFGMLNPNSIPSPVTLPDPCSTDMSDIAAALPLPVQGYDAASSVVAVAGFPVCMPATLKTGSDILVIRRVDTSAPIAQTAAVNGTPYLQSGACQYDTLSYKVDNVPANFTLRQKNCSSTSTTPYADLRRMMVHIYYIDSNSQAGDGIPTLKRMELGATGAMTIEPLVEGIEFMQIEYGLDSNNDGSADSYLAAPALADWPSIMSVKLHIISRNIEPSAGYTDTKTYSLGSLGGTYTPAAADHYKRHVYAQVVRLVNPSGRREVP